MRPLAIALGLSILMALALVGLLLSGWISLNAFPLHDEGPWASRAVFITASLILGAAWWQRQRFLETALSRIQADLEALCWEHIFRLPQPIIEARSPGKWLAVLRNPAADLARIWVTGILNLPLLTGLLLLIASLYLMGALIVVAAVGLAVGLWLWACRAIYHHRKVSARAEMEAWARRADQLQVSPELRQAGVVEVTLSANRRDQDRWETRATEVRRTWAGLLALAALPLLAGLMVIAARPLDPPEKWFACLGGAGTLAGLLLGYFRRGLMLVESRLGWDRLEELLELPITEPIVGREFPASRCRGYLRLENTSFRPHPESAEVVRQVTLEVSPGEMIWVIGRSGSGKSALARLVAGLAEPSDGRILLDGIECRAVSPAEWRRTVALAGESSRLVPYSVRANIALSDPQASLEAVIVAARLAGAHDFILALPQGYETPLTGIKLSAGQTQLLCLARALFQEPSLLILDDATAFLDAESEAAFFTNLRPWARERSVLILSRRARALAAEEMVLVLDDGQIVERGRHAELLAAKGLYSYLAGKS